MSYTHHATEMEQDALRMLTARREELARAQALDSELALVDAALVRLKTSHYGDCAGCGGAVGRARLRAIPEAMHCLQCRDCPMASVDDPEKRGRPH